MNSKVYGNIVFTKFVNDSNGIVYNRLNYTGCTTEFGQNIAINTIEYPIIEKETYTALNNKLIKYIKEKTIQQIDICGIDTECCILKTAFDMFENNYNVKVLENYCACTLGKERHKVAIDILKRNIGKDNIITNYN